MINDDLRVLRGEVRGDDDAQSLSGDVGVRGFTGLLVGLAIGSASWGLILMLWWLV
jgi:hypothetical protein